MCFGCFIETMFFRGESCDMGSGWPGAYIDRRCDGSGELRAC